MTKLAKYLKSSAGLVVAIVALLFLQAHCDLTLPEYTSKIVNEGIQQKGIEDGVPEKMSAGTKANLELFLNDDGKSLLDQYYTQDGDMYVLKEHIKSSEREGLADTLSESEMMLVSLEQMGSEDSAFGMDSGDAMQLPEGVSALDAVKQLPQETRMEMLQKLKEKTADMPDTMTAQSAILFVQEEYEALGEDLDSLQIHYLLRTGGIMLLIALLAMMASVLVTFFSARIAAVVAHDLRNDVYRKVIGFNSHEFNQFSTASLITRSTNDIQQIQMFMTMLFRIVVYAPLMGIGGIFKVLTTNAKMTWTIAIGVIAIMLVIFVLFKVAMPKFKILQKLIDRLNLVTREILTGLSVIRAFSTEKHEEERFDKANMDLMKTNLFVNRAMTFMMPTMMLIMNGLTVLIVYVGASNIDAGKMQVGDLMAFIQYAMQIIMAFLFISMVSIMMPRAQVAAERVNEILDMEVMIKDPEEPKEFLPEKKGEVEFKNVYFCYPDADEAVLHNISFTAPAGKTTAFIGSTGSGKSTLINLIPRFFDVSRGSILVDGVDIRDVKQHDLCEKIGYVPQKGVLFSGTIESNLKYGKEDATIDEVKRAARIAQATDFIEEKEEKYDSPIAQGGSNVSGGQKQRLSIARAIAKDPEIYIFDDSFSALDYKTDVKLRSELQKETNGSTTLIVAQRISTILHADQIIVLDEGNIVGKGTHEELLNTCPVYQQIAKSQLSEDDLKKAREVSDHE